MRSNRNLLAGTARWIISRLSLYERSLAISEDIEEEYYDIRSKSGRLYALVWLWYQILQLTGHYFILQLYWGTTMIYSYLKISFRKLFGSKITSFINVFGLSTGIAFCILTYFYISSELSYDAFHHNADEIYEVNVKLTFGDSEFFNSPSAPLGPYLVNEILEIESFVRILNQNAVLKFENNIYREEIFYTDANFFDFFSFRLKTGSAESIFENPNGILLSESKAVKYFGGRNPVGQIILVKTEDDFEEYVVQGILEKIPDNSSLQFDFLLNFKSDLQSSLYEWEKSRTRIPTFVRISQVDRINDIESKIEEIVTRNTGDSGNFKQSWHLSAVTGHHLNPKSVGVGLESPGDPQYLYILFGISVLVLVIACFNFINLSLGSVTTRLKEIAIRKIIGAQQNQIARQFWFESLMLSFFALCIGILLAELFLPGFNILVQKEMTLSYFSDLNAVIFLIVLLLFIGITEGSFPAILYSRFCVNELLKRNLKVGGKNFITRFIIIVQFTISIILIVSTIVMHQQQNYIMNMELGFNQDNVMVVQMSDEVRITDEVSRRTNLFGEYLSRNTSVRSVAVSSSPLTYYLGVSPYETEDGAQVFISSLMADLNFLSTLDITLLSGTDFSDDKKTVIVNDAFVRRFNLENPLGFTLAELLPDFKHSMSDHKVIGVVKDFHFTSLKYNIEPLTIFPDDNAGKYLYLKIGSDNLLSTVEKIERNYKEFVSDYPFTFTFLDEDIAKMYENENRWSNIITYASVFAIFLSCLGLFGVTYLTAFQKIKEIGIRKVLGASFASILLLINREFLLLIAAANLFAWPAAYFLMNKWLQSFAYKISINPGAFLTAAVIGLIITILSVSYQSVKAVRSNPVDSLRRE